MPKTIIQPGQVYGRLTVLERVENSPHGKTQWHCQCACGVKRIVVAGSLSNGLTKSCGCWNRENAVQRATKHGMSRSSEYKVWYGMKMRCLNPNIYDYPDYGGRGITICAHWLESFENFYADMGPRPGPQYSIDRIDNEGNYEPDNVRWSLPLAQANNKRNNRLITAFGMTKTLAEWGRWSGISTKTLIMRFVRGWDAEKTVSFPVHSWSKRSS